MTLNTWTWISFANDIKNLPSSIHEPQKQKELLAALKNRPKSTDSVQIGGNDSNNSISLIKLLKNVEILYDKGIIFLITPKISTGTSSHGSLPCPSEPRIYPHCKPWTGIVLSVCLMWTKGCGDASFMADAGLQRKSIHYE